MKGDIYNPADDASTIKDGGQKSGVVITAAAWSGMGHSLPEAIAANAKSFPTKSFAQDSTGTRRTYEELHARVCGFSQGLLEMCFAKGDRVAVHSPNRLEVIEVYVACAQLGLICVPIWSELSTSEMTQILRETQPRLLITAPQLCQKVTSLQLHGIRYLSDRSAVFQVDVARRELPFDLSTMSFGSRQPLGKLSYEATIRDATISSNSDWAMVYARKQEVELNSPWVVLYGSGSSTRRGAVRSQGASVRGFVQQVISQPSYHPSDSNMP